MRKRFTLPPVLAFTLLACPGPQPPDCNSGTSQNGLTCDGGLADGGNPDGGCDCGSGCPAGSCFFVSDGDGGGSCSCLV
jgi:hypothetical protein